MNFIFSCWKYLSLIRFAHTWEILLALKDKICIPAQPRNILYIYFTWKSQLEKNNNTTKRNLFTSQKQGIFIVSLGSLSNNDGDGYESIT